MSIRHTLSIVGEILVIVAVGSLVVGNLLGQPILLSYVTSGSMEPTLESGDGFVAVPRAVSGPIEEGDVVVFRAKHVNGGKLTTHRVVDKTDRFYVTKGDANPFTDQANGEPPVKRAQIVAVALEINGQVIVIPHLGTALTGVQAVFRTVQRELALLVGTRALLGIQGLAYLLFAVTLLFYTASAYRRSGRRRPPTRTRSRESGTDPRLFVGALAVVIVLGATAAMVVPAGAQEYGVVSAEFDAPGASVIPTGETETTTYAVGNGGVVPVITYLEPAGDGVSVPSRRMYVSPGETTNATVSFTAPPRTGYYRRYIVEHRYLAVLPPVVIDGLYHVHPWAPVVAIDAVLGGAFYLVGIALVGTRRVRSRERPRNVSTVTRLRRLLRRLYR